MFLPSIDRCIDQNVRFGDSIFGRGSHTRGVEKCSWFGTCRVCDDALYGICLVNAAAVQQ